jgi:hypothetical protein
MERSTTASAGAAGRDGLTPCGSSISAAPTTASAHPQAIRNGASYERTSAVTPPSAGPAIEPIPVAASAAPSDSPRRPGGAVSETRASAEIQLAAEPTPWIVRAAINSSSEWETAIRRDPAAISSSPAISNALRPKRSAARPSGSESSAIGTA